MNPQATWLDALPPSVARSAEVDVGTPIHLGGPSEPAVAFVRSGLVSLHTGRLSLGQAGPGELVGAECLAGEAQREFEAHVAAPSALVVLDPEGLTWVAEHEPVAARQLELSALGSLARRLAEVDHLIAEEAQLLVAEMPTGWAQSLPELGDPPAPEPGTGSGTAVSHGFEALASTLLARFAQFVRPVRLRQGETLVLEGEQGRCVYLMYAGRIDVVRALDPHGLVVRLARLGPEAIVGVGAAETGGRHSATATAVTPVRALRIDNEVWRTLTRLPSPEGTALRRAAVGSLARAYPAARDLVDSTDRRLRAAIHDRLYPDAH